MPDPRLLKAFLTLASLKSFRQSASALNYAPSSLTSQIKALEEELGVELFIRSPREVRLTQAGFELLEPARRVLELNEELLSQARGDRSGPQRLKLRISSSLGLHHLPKIIEAFRQICPDCELTLLSWSRQGIAADFARRGIELALLLADPFVAPGLEFTHLASEELCFVCAPEYLSSPELTLAELGEHRLILTRLAWSRRYELEQAVRRSGAKPRIGVNASSAQMVAALAKSCEGLGLLPRFCARSDLREASLREVQVKELKLSAQVTLISQAGVQPTAEARAFAGAARDFFARQTED